MKNTFEETKVDIFIPIDIETSFQKSHDMQDDKNWYVSGFASTPHLDTQNEIVTPSGIDIDYFKEYGWINYEHKQDAEFVIGTPTENCYVDFQKGLFVEAQLFKSNKYAQQIWELAHTLSKSNSDRKLGFSIEGGIRKRNTSDRRVIEDLVIKNIAITKSPANTHATWDFFTKSWTTGHEINPEKQANGSALRREDLAGAVTCIAQSYSSGSAQGAKEMWEEVSKYLDASEDVTPEVATVLLQISKGISRKDAQEYVAKVLRS